MALLDDSTNMDDDIQDSIVVSLPVHGLSCSTYYCCCKTPSLTFSPEWYLDSTPTVTMQNRGLTPSVLQGIINQLHTECQSHFKKVWDPPSCLSTPVLVLYILGMTSICVCYAFGLITIDWTPGFNAAFITSAFLVFLINSNCKEYRALRLTSQYMMRYVNEEVNGKWESSNRIKWTMTRSARQEVKSFVNYDIRITALPPLGTLTSGPADDQQDGAETAQYVAPVIRSDGGSEGVSVTIM